jgi:amino acid adenylation domain-containing protein
LLRTLQQDSTAGKSHEYLPLADIQSKSQLKTNLIDHILIFENYPLYRQLKDTAVPRLPGSPGTGLDFRVNNITIKEQNNYDFNIVIIPDETIGIKLSFNGLVYDLSLIKGVGSHLKKILGQVLENPGVKLKETEILTAEEKQRILFNFNRQEVSCSREKTIHDFFAEQAVRTPDNIALLGPQQIKYRTAVTSISYRELNDRSNQLAFVLIEKGVQTDTIVAIMMDRCPEMIIGIFGILKAGGAYLPIDPEYPRERIDYMLKDSCAEILVTSPVLSEKFEKLSIVNCQLLIANENSPNRRSFNNYQLTIYNLQLKSTNLAYIIYTSGSTGRPKGVMVEQPSAVNILAALQNSYPLMESDVYLLKTSFIFDVSVTELFGWFLGGGRLAVLEKGGEKDPGKILDTIARERVTHINFVPSMFNVFLEVLNPGNVDKLSGLRYIFLAGEALLPGVVKKYIWLDISASISLENIYGPTEGTVYTSGYGLSAWKGEEVIPIGKPLANTRVYILV